MSTDQNKIPSIEDARKLERELLTASATIGKLASSQGWCLFRLCLLPAGRGKPATHRRDDAQRVFPPALFFRKPMPEITQPARPAGRRA